MARTAPRPQPGRGEVLETAHRYCPDCGGRLRYRYNNRHTVTTLAGLVRLRLRVRRCEAPGCARSRRPYRPEAEGALVLPQYEFGLDVIALVGALRYREHRGVPEIHRALLERGVAVCERTVTNLLDRYDELVATTLADDDRLRAVLAGQGRAILALDGCSPMSATRSCGWCGSACRPRSCSPGACCPRRARTWRRSCARSPRGSACRSRAWSATASTRSAGRCGSPRPGCRTSCASSTTCARPRSRSSRPTATPRRS